MLKVSCNVVVGAGLLGSLLPFPWIFFKKDRPPPIWTTVAKAKIDWSVNDPSASMKLQAEVVAFKGLIHVTEKQVAPSPKSKLVYFFAYSFITKRIMGKLLRYLYLLEARKCPQTVQN